MGARYASVFPVPVAAFTSLQLVMQNKILENNALLQPRYGTSPNTKEHTCVVPTSQLELPQLESVLVLGNPSFLH